jgi:hypothetical protein
LLTLGSVAWAFQLYRDLFGLLLLNEQFLAAMLGLGLALVYLTQPMRAGASRGRVPWYDWALAFASLAAGAYVAFRFPSLSEQVTARPADGLAVAFVIIALVIEALRRVAGVTLTIIVVSFLCYALVGHLVVRQRSEQRHLHRGDHHPVDAPGGLSAACCWRHRGRGVHRGPTDAPGHGRRRIPHGGISPGALPRSRGCSRTAGAALLFRPVRPGRPDGCTRRHHAR